MRRRLILGLALILTVGACGDDDDDATAGDSAADDQEQIAQAGELVGLFRIEPGTCDANGGVTAGSYFKMIEVGGVAGDGPFVKNGDSPCGDKSFSPLLPGDAGGLLTGEFQPTPDPAFDEAGSGTAAAITKPTPFFGVAFANATNEKDPQTGKAAVAPMIRHEGGTLSGDMSAFAAAWNGQHFNQGAPKPGGDMPGLTSALTGTYDESTGVFTMEWSSQIEGGPFNSFTGIWHFEGVFEPSS